MRATSACSRCQPIPWVPWDYVRTPREPRVRSICPEVVGRELSYPDSSRLKSGQSNWAGRGLNNADRLDGRRAGELGRARGCWATGASWATEASWAAEEGWAVEGRDWGRAPGRISSETERVQCQTRLDRLGQTGLDRTGWAKSSRLDLCKPKKMGRAPEREDDRRRRRMSGGKDSGRAVAKAREVAGDDGEHRLGCAVLGTGVTRLRTVGIRRISIFFRQDFDFFPASYFRV
ncbi:hypothetical protein CRG98_032460 [Punica granatum]|uniref:Uncharacterized protein n=1 Tax=Punica granatum TaxID=22663 RepID=A0A2I0IUP8_PUNGR|nr:hypothetical protein CRG98_032460 [Punica granatum]